MSQTQDQYEGNMFDQMKEDLDHQLRWRRRICRILTLGNHWFGKPWRVDVGPIGFDESNDTLLGWNKQCRICYECVGVEELTRQIPAQQ